jgi:hypothetical protein
MSSYAHDWDQNIAFQELEELKKISYKVKNMIQGKGMAWDIIFSLNF